MISLTISLTLLLALYFILWHYTSLRISGSHSVMDVPEGFMGIASSYLIVSVIITFLIFFILLFVKRRLLRKIYIGAVLFLFIVSEVVRMLDWGALFFGGNHVDSNFWAHAFYADGLVFLITKEAITLYAASALFFTALYFILKHLSMVSAPRE